MKTKQIIDAIVHQYNSIARNILRREPEPVPVEMIRHILAERLNDFNNGAIVTPYQITTDGTTTEWELPAEVDLVESVIIDGEQQHLDSYLDKHVE